MKRPQKAATNIHIGFVLAAAYSTSIFHYTMNSHPFRPLYRTKVGVVEQLPRSCEAPAAFQHSNTHRWAVATHNRYTAYYPDLVSPSLKCWLLFLTEACLWLTVSWNISISQKWLGGEKLRENKARESSIFQNYLFFFFKCCRVVFWGWQRKGCGYAKNLLP